MATGTAMTDYFEARALNHFFRNTASTAPTTVYVALYTSAPGETGGGTEVSGGSYARQAVTFGAPDASSIIANSADINFPVASANWGTITSFAILDASTSGNMFVYGTLTASKVINNGDQFKFPTGNLTVQFD